VKSNSRSAAILALALCGSAAAAQHEAAAQLKYVVIVARHGVRSPTWDAGRLNQYSAEPWPDWGVPPGYLTAHGRALETILGSYYRDSFVRDGLLRREEACRDQGRVYIWADKDQRTLETARALAEALQPGCAPPIHSQGGDGRDPIFSGARGQEPALAAKALRERAGDGNRLLADHHGAFETLQFILTGGKQARQALVERPGDGDWQASLATASSLSEDLLLEYADGVRGRDLGWGRLTRENLFEVLELHRVYSDLTRRTPYFARARGSLLLKRVLASMAQAVTGRTVGEALGPVGTSVLILSGHDTNLSNISGLLELAWKLEGYQPDETPPGGALVFSLWRDPSNGTVSVRAQFVAQTLDQMREGTTLTVSAPPATQEVSIPGCGGPACSWEKFRAVVERAVTGAN
jgi:4-phytase / acid phosphatase